MCPVCSHVCSMFARAHTPSNPGLEPGSGLLQVAGQVPGELSGSLAGRVPGDAEQVHPPRLVLDDERDSVECPCVAVHRICVTWESSQVRTACGRQGLLRSDST